MSAKAKELRQRRAAVVRQMQEMLDQAGDAAFSPEQEAAYQGLDTEQRGLEQRAARVESTESLVVEMGQSRGVIAGRQDRDPAETRRGPAPEAGDGFMAVRVIRSLASANGDTERAARIATSLYGDGDPATRALAASDATAGGVLIDPEHATGVIELFRPASAVRRLNPTYAPMDSGTLSLPKLTGGASASYIGENQNALKTEQTTGLVQLVAKKLAALVPVSNDLIRRPSRSADTLVRDDLVTCVAQRSDLAFIRNDGSNGTPRGLRHWAPSGNVIAANGTVNLANVTNDLSALQLALEGADVRMIRPGWMFSPRTKHYLMNVRDGNGNYAFRAEMLGGTLNGYPFSSTSQIPNNLGGGSNASEVYFADFADVVIGETESLIISVSDQAAYHDGSNVVAAFSLDQTVIRVIAEHDLAMRHEESVAVLTGVTWGV